MVSFKEWIHESLMHGGLSDTPFNPGNSNMPCRSKHQTQDGKPVDDEPLDVPPEKLFGFRKWMSKKWMNKLGDKRPPNRIHKPRSISLRIDHPMM